MSILVINFFLYLSFFLFFLIKRKRMCLDTFLWLEYTIIAFLGVYTLLNGIYEGVFGSKNLDSVTLAPNLLCLMGFFLAIYPFSKATVYDYRVPSIRGVNKIITVWFVVMVSFTFLKMYETVVAISMGLGDMYDARHNLGERVFDYSGIPLLAKINLLGYIFKVAVNPFLCFFFVKNIHQKKYLYLLILCFLPDILAGIAGGSRGALFGTFMTMAFYYVLFKKYLPPKVLRKVHLIGVVFASAIVFYSVSITIARYQAPSQSSSGILRYFGECFPNLNFYIWDKVKIHPMGLRFFPEILKPELLTNWDSTSTMYAYWHHITGVPVLIFKTLFGDLYIDFGVMGAFVILCVFFKLLCSILRNGVTYYNISYVLFFYQIVVFGFAGFTQIGGFNNLLIVCMVLFNVFLKSYFKCRR